MKRTAVFVSLLGLAAIWAGIAYQSGQTRENDYARLLREGDEALQSEQSFQAIEAYSNALYLRPDSMLAHLRRGEAYQRRGDVTAAARDFQGASAIDPSATRPIEALGDIRYDQGYYDRAAELYQKLVSLDDHSPAGFRKLALSLYRAGKLDAAMDAIEQLARLGNQQADDYYLLGLSLRARRQLNESAAAFEHAVRLGPSLTPPREELVDVYDALGRRAEQIDQLQMLAGLDSQNAARHVALGLAYARMGRVEIAVDTLRTALERNSDRSQIYAAIGHVWLESAPGRTDPTAVKKAVEALEQAATDSETPSAVLVLYGRALQADGQAETAERVMQQATERFPVEPMAFVEYATAAERSGHLHEARTALLKYGALTTDDRALANRASRIGALSLKLNEPATAVRWLRQAEPWMPDDPRFLAAFADALLRTGNRMAARAAAIHGLRLDPSSVLLRSVEIRTRDY